MKRKGITNYKSPSSGDPEYQGASFPLRKQPRFMVCSPKDESLPENERKRPVNPHTGFPGSVKDRSHMGTFAEAEAALEKGYGTHVSIVLWKEHFDDGLACLDLDVPKNDGDHQDIDAVADRAEEEHLIVVQSVSGEAWHVWAMGPPNAEIGLHHAGGKTNAEYFDGSHPRAMILDDPATAEVLEKEARHIDGGDFFASLAKDLGGEPHKNRAKPPENTPKTGENRRKTGIKLSFSDVIEVLGEPVRVDRSGEHWYHCPHPDHTDEEPSFSVRDDGDGNALWNCFVCDTPEDNKTGRVVASLVREDHLSEQHFGNEFIRRHSDDYKHDKTCWWRYRDGVWRRDSDSLAHRRMRELMPEVIRGRHWEDPGKDIPRAEAKWLNNKTEVAALKSIQSHAEIMVDPKELDKIGILGLPGGKAWVLESGEVRNAERDDWIIDTLGCVPEKGDLGEWKDKFLEALKPHYGKKEAKDVLRMFLELTGAALFSYKEFDAFAVVVGADGSGKSTFSIDVLRGAFGGYCHRIDGKKLCSSKEHHDVWLMPTRLNRIVYANEVPPRTSFDSATLSALVEGGSELGTRKLYGQPITFVPRASLFMSCNHLPKGSGGVFRRIRPVYFDQRIPDDEQDTELPGRLREYYPAILHASRAAFLKALERGKLTMPKRVLRDMGRYREQSDHVAKFCEERLEKKGKGIQQKDAYDAYKTWCDETGVMRKHAKGKFVDDVCYHMETHVSEDRMRLDNGKIGLGIVGIRLKL